MKEKILKEINRRIIVSGQKRNNDKKAHAVWAELVDLERWILENCDNERYVRNDKSTPKMNIEMNR